MSDIKRTNEYFRAACVTLIKARRGVQKKLEADLGWTKTTISFIVNGRRQASPEQQEAIAGAMGMSLADFLAAGKSALDSGELFHRRADGVEDRPFMDSLPAPRPKERGEEQFVFVPFLDVVKDGESSACIQSDESYLAFQKAWLTSFGMAMDMAIWRVRSVEMEPTVSQKDVALIDTGDLLINPGRIYLVRIGEEVRLGRVEHPDDTSQRVRVVFDNSRFEPIETREDEFQVIGRLVWIGRVAINL